MDLQAKANICINTGRGTITFGQTSPTVFAVRITRKISLEPYTETKVSLTAPKTFSQGLIESSSSLPDKVQLMDGVISSASPTECFAVIANFSHLPITLPTNTLAGPSSVLTFAGGDPPSTDREERLNVLTLLSPN